MRRWILMLAACTVVLAGCQSVPVREPQPGRQTPAEINVQLGIGYMQQGENELAMKKLKRALGQDPGLPSAHAAIALLYERLGETEQAERHHREAVRLDPKDSYAQNAYGAFLCKQGRLADAERHFVAALENPLYETPEIAYTNAGLCARKVPDLDKAERYFRRALEANPRFAVALYQMAKLSYEKGRYLRARGYLQRYLEVAPHTAKTLWLGIRIERELGDKDTVASYTLLLKAKFPDSEETRLLLESEEHGQAARD